MIFGPLNWFEMFATISKGLLLIMISNLSQFGLLHIITMSDFKV